MPRFPNHWKKIIHSTTDLCWRSDNYTKTLVHYRTSPYLPEVMREWQGVQQLINPLYQFGTITPMRLYENADKSKLYVRLKTRGNWYIFSNAGDSSSCCSSCDAKSSGLFEDTDNDNYCYSCDAKAHCYFTVTEYMDIYDLVYNGLTDNDRAGLEGAGARLDYSDFITAYDAEVLEDLLAQLCTAG